MLDNKIIEIYLKHEDILCNRGGEYIDAQGRMEFSSCIMVNIAESSFIHWLVNKGWNPKIGLITLSGGVSCRKYYVEFEEHPLTYKKKRRQTNRYDSIIEALSECVSTIQGQIDD